MPILRRFQRFFNVTREQVDEPDNNRLREGIEVKISGELSLEWEGTILAEAKAGKPSRYCLPNGGYTAVFLEITLAYTNFLSGEERKNNVAILSKPTAIVLDDFLDSRYRCKTKW
jgi:hypothetical protein